MPGPASNRPDRAGAPFVVVTHRLPGAEPDVGITGLRDEPTTAALEAMVHRLHGHWVGLPQGDPPTRVPSSSPRAGARATFVVPARPFAAVPARPFAERVAGAAGPSATVWVHDNRLYRLPERLRALRPDLRIGFFHQGPGPIGRLPWQRAAWVRALTAADHVGFSTLGTAERFQLLSTRLNAGGRRPTVGVHPLAIDTRRVAAISARADVARRVAEVREWLGHPRVVVLSVDPAGPERAVRRFEAMFADGLLPAEDIVIIHHGTSPGERSIPASRYGRHYLLDAPNLAERVALYQAADLLVATDPSAGPTAMEFIVGAGPRGALVLGIGTGLGEALPGARLVDPDDPRSLPAAILSTLDWSESERSSRMRTMRAYPTRYDNHAWARHFVMAVHTNPPWPPPRPARPTRGGRFPVRPTHRPHRTYE